MKLDFTTLFVIILLDSFGFAIVWAIISYSYKSLRAARYWFASLTMTCLSGPALVLGEASQLWNYVGNLLVVFGFGLLWQGIRVFFDRQPTYYGVALIFLASALSMVFLGSSPAADNLIFAISQLIPMGLAVFTLMTANGRQVGTSIAALACGIFILGQGSEAITNALRLAGMMSDETYYHYATWFLVCAIVGASISNLGFLLMAVDRLRGELHALATRDELTGLPNRRALAERISLIGKRAKRLQQSVAVLMMDLDKFKSINDSHGHPAGDAALKHIAEVTKNELREVDFLVRIGGDEFCILIPDADLEAAAATARAIGVAVATTPFCWRGKPVSLSVSIGFVSWSPSSGSDLAGSLPLADEDLLQRKRVNSPLLRPSDTC